MTLPAQWRWLQADHQRRECTMPPTTVPLSPHDGLHPQARVCAACEVRRSSLFGALPPASLARISTLITAQELKAGDRLYGSGEVGSSIYTIRSGIVRFERLDAGGDRRIARLAGRSDLIGQEALLQRPYADDAVACTPVQLCRIPGRLIDEWGEAHAPLSRELMRRWQEALEQAAAWAANLTTGVARRRVLHLLARLEALGGDSGVIWLPRRDEMSAMLDITVETASRIVSQLARDGVIGRLPRHQARVDLRLLSRAMDAYAHAPTNGRSAWAAADPR